MTEVFVRLFNGSVLDLDGWDLFLELLLDVQGLRFLVLQCLHPQCFFIVKFDLLALHLMRQLCDILVVLSLHIMELLLKLQSLAL
jgi:hypothetical protein